MRWAPTYLTRERSFAASYNLGTLYITHLDTFTPFFEIPPGRDSDALRFLVFFFGLGGGGGGVSFFDTFVYVCIRACVYRILDIRIAKLLPAFILCCPPPFSVLLSYSRRRDGLYIMTASY